MSLAERLTTWTPVVRNNCRTCNWYGKQTEADKEAFNQFLALVDAKRASRAQVLRIFQEEGLDCGESSFFRHLRNCRDAG